MGLFLSCNSFVFSVNLSVVVRTLNLTPYLFINYSGAFGVVHRCREKSTGNFYAVKFVDVPTPQDKQTVHNEIEVMKELHHPKLIKLHEAFEDKNETAMVMEL